MPRYHFHVRDGVDRPDHDGIELSSVVAARAEALMLVGKILIDAGMRRDPGEDWTVEVTDGTGLTLFRMDFIVAAAATLAA